ncbi:hypothetical protein HDV02_004477, partial [Globomyces sp. JEL0801]
MKKKNASFAENIHKRGLLKKQSSEKELDKESLELEKKTPLNTCLIGFFAFVVIGGAV